MNIQDTVTPFDKLVEEAQAIQEFLEIPISDDALDAIERGNMLLQYQARSGKMLADAKFHLNNEMNTEVVNIIKSLLEKFHSAKVQNGLIDSVAKKERMLVDWCDRINASCKHQMDWCRTIVSKAKEEMKMSGYFPQP